MVKKKLGLKKFCFQKNLGSIEILCPKYFGPKKKFLGSNKIFGPFKKSRPRKKICPKNYGFEKNIGPKKILGSKEILVSKKIWDLKKSGVEIKFHATRKFICSLDMGQRVSVRP